MRHPSNFTTGTTGTGRLKKPKGIHSDVEWIKFWKNKVNNIQPDNFNSTARKISKIYYRTELKKSTSILHLKYCAIINHTLMAMVTLHL